jgi:hypothetical protein
MAFRQTTFDPTQSQQFQKGPPQVNMSSMEEGLAREMARMKMEQEKRQREVSKICSGSEDLRELMNKINSAYLNKERSSQMTENQYRRQQEVVSISIGLIFKGTRCQR